MNKAAEAKALSQKLLQRLHGTIDMAGSKKLPTGNTSQNVTNSRHLEVLFLEVGSYNEVNFGAP